MTSPSATPAPAPPTDPTPDPLATPFLRQLVRQLRAHDSFGTWEGKPDAEILAPYIVTKEQRREIPIIGDPDPDILWRVEIYYAAVGLAIETEAGRIASPIMKMSHEGFGRILLTTGRLVVIDKTLRDVHRFGFESLEALADKGSALVAEAVALIRRYPEVAGL